MNQFDVLIVGAGMAGLVAAQHLQAIGLSVMVVEKDSIVGGRMATRQMGAGVADHGAQFFTAREAPFQKLVDEWQQAGLAFVWSQGWAGEPEGEFTADGHPRYAVKGGMTAVPHYLAQHLTVRTGVTLASVTAVAGGWQAKDENGQIYAGQALILTPPVPQSLALLAAGQTPLAPDDQAALNQITYAPCLTGLFWLDGEANLPSPGALQRPEHAIIWIANNRQKGISPAATILTVHVHPEQSQLWWLAPAPELRGMLYGEIRPFLPTNTIIHNVHIHRWRFALPTTLHPERHLLAKNLPPLAFAGDAFNGPRVEGAALSGLSAAKTIGEQLDRVP